MLYFLKINRKGMSILLITNLIFNAIGQTTNNSANSDSTVTESKIISSVKVNIEKTDIETKDSTSIDTVVTKISAVDTTQREMISPEIKLQNSSYGSGGFYNQLPLQQRGIPSSQNEPIDRSNQRSSRKLMDSTSIKIETADSVPLITDTAQVKVYKMSKAEKRILLITGAVIVTGGLVIVLVKILGKDKGQQEKDVIPEPPSLPEF